MNQWALAGVLALAAGCAEERPPRSFVQPNILKKSDLQGTFQYVQTVTEAPPTNGMVFTGLMSDMMKIRFDVQEKFIYARRAYEHIEGSEDRFVLEKLRQQLSTGEDNPVNAPGYKGEVLAAWPITSQFDIIRDFNSTTGEQTNKIIESTERPWQEREFIRVDWSKSEAKDVSGLGLYFFFADDPVDIQAISFWESDPKSPDALHLERAGQADRDGFQQGEMTYLDITNKWQLTPLVRTYTYEEDGQAQSFEAPPCLLSYQQEDCAGQTVKLRHAFVKVRPIHSYQPRLWDGAQMELFGVWDVGLRRMTYNRQYGVTNSGFFRVASRFNLWEKSCKTGSVCYQARIDADTGEPVFVVDGKEVRGEANSPIIPYADRKVRTIPYYAEGTQAVIYKDDPLFPDGVDMIYPHELWPEFREVVRQWNEAARVAASDAQQKPLTQIPDIFVPCHNPVRLVMSTVKVGGQDVQIPPDPEACWKDLQPERDPSDETGEKLLRDKQGNPIYRVRQGDPRRSTIFWVNQQQNGGPLGYGPGLYDPITGETMSGQAYIFGGAIDSYSARSRDLMLLQNGEIAEDDFAAGVDVKAWVTQNKLDAASGTNRRAHQRTYEEKDILTMSRAMDFDWAKAFGPANGYPALDPTSPKKLKDSMTAREKAIDQAFWSRAVDTRDTRMGRIINTPLEQMAVTSEVMAGSNVSPAKSWGEMTRIEKLMASPARARVLQKAIEERRRQAETMGIDYATFDDPGLGQHLEILKAKYGADLLPFSEEIRKELRKEIYLGVTLHEVGHNMGMRHNFRGSYDAMNYFPEYWRLRTEAINHPDPGSPAGDGKLHPRYINKPGGRETVFEKEAASREYQYSSIMDYGSEFHSDFKGLGSYDKAFMKFSYAEYVEVFTAMKTDDATKQKMGSLHTFQGAFGFPSALGPGRGLSAIPYHTYPDLFEGGYQGMYQRQDVPYSSIDWFSIDNDGNRLRGASVEQPLVPYYFCSDEFVGNLTCQRFDSGADNYEQIADIISRYENYYVLNNFKRDKMSFHSSNSYKGRVASRYLDALRQSLTWYVLLRASFQDFLTTNANLFPDPTNPESVIELENKFFTDENGWGNFTLAVSLGFDELGKILTTPSAGLHAKFTDLDGKTSWKQFRDEVTFGSDAQFHTVGLIDGKYIDTTWDFDACGYYWADECQSRVGYTVDKLVALDILTQSQAYFTGRDTNVDVRKYAIGYILPYKGQIEEKFGALFANDFKSLSPSFGARDPFTGDYPVIQPSWAMDDPYPVGAQGQDLKPEIIDPQASFSLSLYAGLYGLSAFPTTFDHDFLDATKLFVVGNGEASVPDSTILSDGTSDPTQLVSHCVRQPNNGPVCGTKEWFVVLDAQSGKTYAAHAMRPKAAVVPDLEARNNGNLYETKTVDLRRDIAVRMLEQYQRLASNIVRAKNLSNDPMVEPNKVTKIAGAELEFNNFRQNIEVMRSLHNAFGYGPYRTDAPFYY